MCEDGEATGKDSRADRIFRGMVVASTSSAMPGDFSCGKAFAGESTTPTHNNTGQRGERQIRSNQGMNNDPCTPCFSYAIIVPVILLWTFTHLRKVANVD